MAKAFLGDSKGCEQLTKETWWWTKEVHGAIRSKWELQKPIAHSLWTHMLQLFGIDWVMPGSVVDLLFCWYHWLGKHSFDIWNLVPGCLMWIIWTKRNRRSFEDKGKSVVQLLDLCQRTLFDWSRCWGFSDCFTLMEFLSSISFF